MSFSVLRDIFIGRYGALECSRKLVFSRSPLNARKYLIDIHRFVFPKGDVSKNEVWGTYPSVSNIAPIKERDLHDSDSMEKQANKLSFDISRFTDFLVGYTRVNDDIKPVMLHYSMIYLFDFFSRTWLNYGRNWGHGMKLVQDADGYGIKIQRPATFQRAVDAFCFVGQSSLFSLDDGYGIFKVNDEYAVQAEKMKYSDNPQSSLTSLMELYGKFGSYRTESGVGLITMANHILVGYAILFIISSLSRYRAEDWFRTRENRDLMNKSDALQYVFLYEWTPGILSLTILKNPEWPYLRQ